MLTFDTFLLATVAVSALLALLLAAPVLYAATISSGLALTMLRKVLELPLQLLLIILSPLVFLCIPKGWEKMPAGTPLKLWDEYTFGINGTGCGDWIDATKSDHPPTAEAAHTLKWRVLWFIRNGNWLDHQAACIPADIRALSWTGDPDVEDAPLGCAGMLHVIATDKAGKKFECLYIVHRCDAKNPGKCFRFYGGYKLKELTDFWRNNGNKLPYELPAIPVSDVLQRVFAPMPHKVFRNVTKPAA